MGGQHAVDSLTSTGIGSGKEGLDKRAVNSNRLDSEKSSFCVKSRCPSVGCPDGKYNVQDV